jgi:hypothetical protein
MHLPKPPTMRTAGFWSAMVKEGLKGIKCSRTVLFDEYMILSGGSEANDGSLDLK